MTVVKAVVGLLAILAWAMLTYKVVRSCVTRTAITFDWAWVFAAIGLFLAATWQEINWILH